MKRTFIFIMISIMITASCSRDKEIIRAASSITAEELREYTMAFGSDSLMGRMPFTEGEKKSVRLLASYLSDIGFQPAFGDSYFQEVPMTEITSSVTAPVTIRNRYETINLTSPDDIAIISPSKQTKIELRDIPVVFCGFGIVAPEYSWDDYRNLDVKGKCAVVLVNDPGLYTGDTTLFQGRTMTYYGRWTYKYEEAARQGAAAILIIHETTGAGYDYSIPRKSSISSRLQMADPGTYQCDITGWLSTEAASKVFGSEGYNVDSLRLSACSPDFCGFEMNAYINANITNTIRNEVSNNVAGILRGTTKPEEAIVITAHWDHFGIGEPEMGDSIYNGTIDNGTSMAWALEIGEAFAALRGGTRRSVILLFPTSEEQGLLGSGYFVAHSPVKTDSIIACFNNDMLLPEGRMKDFMITGYGKSDLEDMLARAAARQDRYILPDPHPETGMYFRSDHFPFARAGVPSLFARGNCDSREFGKEWAYEREKDFLQNIYHKPADNYCPEMNFDGIAEDASAIFEVAAKIADSDIFPAWKKGSEFAAKRMSKK